MKQAESEVSKGEIARTRGYGTAVIVPAFKTTDYGRYCVGIATSEPYQRVSPVIFDNLDEARSAMDTLQSSHRQRLSIVCMPTAEEQAAYQRSVEHWRATGGFDGGEWLFDDGEWL